MIVDLLKDLQSLQHLSEKVDYNSKIISIIKKFFPIQSFTLFAYDVTDYTYHLVFSTVAIDNPEEVYIFESEILPDDFFNLYINEGELPVYWKLLFEESNAKYLFLSHEPTNNLDSNLLLAVLENYTTAVRNRLVHEYYVTNLLNSQSQLDVLNEIGDILGTFNLDVVLSKLLENSNNIVAGDVGIIFLIDNNENKLKSRIQWGVKEDIILQIKFKDSDKALVQESYDSKKQFFFDTKQSRYAFENIKYPEDVYIDSILSIPLFTNNENLGVMLLLNFKIDEVFTENKILTVETLARIASIGIENSLFFERSIQQEKINNQLKIASEIQNNLLPQDSLIFEGFEITGFNKSAMNIGGDFFNYFTYENKIYSFLGDVAGKGIPAALLTTMAMIVIKTSVLPEINIEDVVGKVNNIIAQNSMTENYLTLAIFEIDTINNQINFVNCGHTEILYYDSKNRSITEYSSQNLPVGLFEDSPYISNQIMINSGDILITFSDGVPDAVNQNGESYGLENFKKIIIDQANQSIDTIKDELLKDIDQFCSKAPQFDDLTILAIRKA